MVACRSTLAGVEGRSDVAMAVAPKGAPSLEGAAMVIFRSYAGLWLSISELGYALCPLGCLYRSCVFMQSI